MASFVFYTNVMSAMGHDNGDEGWGGGGVTSKFVPVLFFALLRFYYYV